MKSLFTTSLFCLALLLLASELSAQDNSGGIPTVGGGSAGGTTAGRAASEGFGGADGQIGGRQGAGDEIVDNRAATGTGENNRTLGGGQNQANNMNFLQALLGGNVGNQNVNQNTPLRGRGIRAPLRLGFNFEGVSVNTGIKNLNARVVRIPKLKNSSIRGVLQGRTLLLVGEVSSLEEASLASRIARFEPGVDQVKSLLTVSSGPKSETLPRSGGLPTSEQLPESVQLPMPE